MSLYTPQNINNDHPHESTSSNIANNKTYLIQILSPEDFQNDPIKKFHKQVVEKSISDFLIRIDPITYRLCMDEIHMAKKSIPDNRKRKIQIQQRKKQAEENAVQGYLNNLQKHKDFGDITQCSHHIDNAAENGSDVTKWVKQAEEYIIQKCSEEVHKDSNLKNLDQCLKNLDRCLKYIANSTENEPNVTKREEQIQVFKEQIQILKEQLEHPTIPITRKPSKRKSYLLKKSA